MNQLIDETSRMTKAMSITQAIKRVVQAEARLLGLFSEIRGEPLLDKVGKQKEESPISLKEVLDSTPDNLNGIADNIGKTIEEIRAILF